MSLSASTDSDFKDTESEDNDHLRSGGAKNLLVSVGFSEFNCNVKGPHPTKLASAINRICRSNVAGDYRQDSTETIPTSDHLS